MARTILVNLATACSHLAALGFWLVLFSGRVARLRPRSLPDTFAVRMVRSTAAGKTKRAARKPGAARSVRDGGTWISASGGLRLGGRGVRRAPERDQSDHGRQGHDDDDAQPGEVGVAR